MLKRNINIGLRIKHWFTHHPWLKLLSLVLAIVVWFYIKEEMNRFNF